MRRHRRARAHIPGGSRSDGLRPVRPRGAGDPGHQPPVHLRPRRHAPEIRHIGGVGARPQLLGNGRGPFRARFRRDGQHVHRMLGRPGMHRFPRGRECIGEMVLGERHPPYQGDIRRNEDQSLRIRPWIRLRRIRTRPERSEDRSRRRDRGRNRFIRSAPHHRRSIFRGPARRLRRPVLPPRTTCRPSGCIYPHSIAHACRRS